MNNGMYEVIDSVSTDDGTVVEVLQYPQLAGSADLRVAHNLFYATKSGMRLKMIRIKLNNSHALIEPGALYFMKGNLEMKASSGGGIIRGLSRKMLSGETFFVNETHGAGEIYLEPSFGHFFLYHIKKDDKAIIVDKGLFYAGTAGLDINFSLSCNKRFVSSNLYCPGRFTIAQLRGIKRTTANVQASYSLS